MKKLLLFLTVFFASSSLMADMTSVQQTLVGTEFIVILDGVDVFFTITDDGDTKTAKVGRKDGNYSNTAVDHNITQKTITIPQTVKYNGINYTVTAIGEHAFHQIFDLQEIIMPSTIENIEDYAFMGGDNLTTIEIPASVTSIGYHAFLSCPKLVNFTVSKDNPKFDSRDNCNAVIETASNKLVVGIINSTIPATVTTIGQNAFCNHGDLHITIPATVTAIEYGAFQWCHTSVFTVESSTPLEIDGSVFYGVDDLSRHCILRVPDGAKEAYLAAPGWNKFPPEYVLEGDEVMEFTEDVTTEGETVNMSFAITDRNAKTVKVGQLVGSWEKTAVSRDITATSIAVPETITHAGVKYTVTAIGDFAFCSIESLQHLTLPSTITSIGEFAFYDLSIQEMTLPTAVTSIGMRTFGNCWRLKSLEIPANVKAIGIDQFHGCSELESLTVAQGNDYYESPDGCNAIIEKSTHKLVAGTIATKSIPASVIEIGDNAFSGVQDLILTIPSTVRKIGFEAFSNCRRSVLTVEYSAEDLPNIDVDANAFRGADDDRYGACILRVPKNTKSAYRSATGWSVYKEDNILEGNEGQEFSVPVATGEGSTVDVIFTIISDGQTKRVKVGHLVEANMNMAVSNETFATSITIPETVTHEGTEYTVTSIGGYAFMKICIKGIALPSSITAIGSNAFAFSSLTSLEIPAGVTTIGNMAFFYCEGLSSIVSKIEKPFAIENAFSTTTLNNATLTVPAGTKDLYLSTDGWKNFSRILYEGEEIVKSRTIHVTTAGTLPDLIANNEKYVLEELTLTGELNGTDFRLLRDMAGNNYKGELTNGKLRTLDLSGTRIVAGGDMYLDTDMIRTSPNSTFSGSFHFYTETDKMPRQAFMGSILSSIILPNTVTSIVELAFAQCRNFTSITIPSSVTHIGSCAFLNCSGLTSITIPNSVTSIESQAFCDCINLTSLTIPSSVTNIGYYAFYGCNGLTSIVVESGNTKFDSRNNCNAIIETSTNKLILGCKNTIIPSTVTSIGDNAFSCCSSLTSITIPNTVTSIGESAFWSCGLTSITIPNSVTSIGNYVFGDCSDLASIIVESGNTKYDSRNGCNAIIETATNKLICGCKNTIIPNSVTSIGGAFRGCIDLTTITIPNSVTQIGNNAFMGCSGLTSIAMSNSVTTIGRGAFGGCNSLTSITIPKSLRSIGNSAFADCTSLEAIVIPRRVQSIGSYTFSNCKALLSITSESESPFDIEDNVFPGNQSNNPQENVDIYSTATLYVPTGTKALYQSKTGWSNFKNIEEIEIVGIDPKRTIHVATAGTLPDLISEEDKYEIEELTLTGELNGTDFRLLRDMAGNNYKGELTYGILRTLDLSGTRIVAGGDMYLDTDRIRISPTSRHSDSFHFYTETDKMPRQAFIGCSLSSLILPNTVTSIVDYAFAHCSGITSITIPNTVAYIGHCAFYCCSGLTSITIPNSVISIGGQAFEYCSSLVSIVVESGNTKYDSRNNCNAIIETSTNKLITGCQNTIIPSTVTIIGNSAFVGCSSLTSISIPNSVTTIEEAAFWNCGLTSISIPNSVTNIDNHSVFSRCRDLASIVVESGNTKYDSRNGCNAIIETATNKLIYGCKNTIIPNSVTSIGEIAFRDCSNLTTISIPNSVTYIGNDAFEGCSGLTSLTMSNSVTTIGSGAFFGCNSLTSITIPKTVTSIGEDAFWNCGLTSIVSEIVNPFEIDENVFSDYTKPTLKVPFGCKEKYQAAEGWKNFVNIEELGLAPMDEQEDVEYGEGGSIDENTNLEGTIIDNVFYNISTENGGFDAEEQCIVVKKAMTDEEIESVFGEELLSDEVMETFAGLVIQVPAGNGSVMINAQTTGGMALKVKIGSADPMTLEFSGKMKVSVPYNVIEPTYVYIYAGESAAGCRTRTVDADENSLCIYGLGLETANAMKGDPNGDNSVDVVDVVAVVDHILERPLTVFYLAAADVNSDRVIDVVDVVGVVDIILEKPSAARLFGGKLEQVNTDNDQLLLMRNDDGRYMLNLFNEGRYTAAQFDIRLSKGQQLEDIRLDNSRMGHSHNLSYSALKDGRYRVIIHSVGNDAISGHAGELLSFRVAGVEGAFAVDNIVFVTEDQARKQFEAIYSQTTSIKNLDVSNNPEDVYSLDGRLVKKSATSLQGLPKGVYIVNGQKRVIR